ncbi:hypothetical protein EZI54_12115 [Marinobacter halodurans]|uniref:Transporter substrate-binding domain-containing protein n=1 Tax=Marinobacter halodurans TaxID=2528979 RepID=A0ABY1ZM17_9GAMM|nr:transporter substrate-binding domain-containing protein [Marinobacter halodurans]TBW55193.1 hypothetical protein EZI54_12115 [Marinobacter halodurans]
MTKSLEKHHRIKRLINLIAACILAAPIFTQAQETLRVGLEPLPPLIREDGSGQSVEWLRALAKQANMRLHVSIMPYSRAKLALMAGDVDLIGHTPFGLETERFYDYAIELDYRVPTRMDVFSPDPDDLEPEAARRILIGTPFGNSAFISELTGLDRDCFVEGSLPRVVNMMLAGRVNAVIFERMSVVSQIRKQTTKPVYYRLVKQIDAGFAVRRAETALIERLNNAARKVDSQAIYAPYINLLDGPDSGTITPGTTDASGQPLPQPDTADHQQDSPQYPEEDRRLRLEHVVMEP